MNVPTNLSELSDVGIAVVCSIIGGTGGALSYALKVQEGKPWRWREFFLHCSISGFAGWVMYQFSVYVGLPAGVAGAVCGVSGWMGTRAIRIVEVVIRKRAGVEREDLKDGDD